MIHSTKTSRSTYQIRMNIPESVEDKVRSNKGGIYKLYWLRHKDHTDVTSQGYVGITGRSLRTRMTQHAVSAEDGVDYPVYNAIRKYGDEIIVDVLCIGDEEYILDLEQSLRPDINIGWNIDTGGLAQIQKQCNTFGVQIVQMSGGRSGLTATKITPIHSNISKKVRRCSEKMAV